MEYLANKIKVYLDREVDFFKDILLKDNADGRGGYIAEWNVDEVQPTDEQLNALEAEALTLENNIKVINTRKNLYGTTKEQLEYIVENGVSAFIEKQNQIKLENPKS